MSAKTVHTTWLAMILAGCALTPEQQAERAAQKKQLEQTQQVTLAQQCDRETAELMQEQFEQQTYSSEKDKQNFRMRYIEKVNDPMFQACYKLAWQNHLAQERLRQMRYDNGWWWHRPFTPWWW